MNAPVPAISVVIPHLNQPEHLERCLSSLKAQTLAADRFNVVVVDNGSANLPVPICSAFEGVELVREPTPGPGPARNRGVEVSRGSILAFIDADCVAANDWLATIAARLGADRSCNIIGGDVRIGCLDTCRSTMLEAYESVYAYRQQEYIERLGFSGTGNLAVRRSVFDEIGTFLGKEVAEDREWGRRAGRLGYTIEYVPQMMVFHPARSSFAQLRAKWDRHVSHDFEEYVHGPVGYVRWFALILAVAASPVLEVKRILTSPRISTWRERCLAALVLIRIRMYRARKMLELLIRGKRANASRAWNVE